MMIKEALTGYSHIEDIKTLPNAKLSKIKEISKVGLEAYVNNLLNKWGIKHRKVEFNDDWRSGKYSRDYINPNCFICYSDNINIDDRQKEEVLLRLKSHIEKNFPSLKVDVVDNNLKFTILTKTKDNNWNNGRTAKDNLKKEAYFGYFNVLLKNGKKYENTKIKIEDDGRIKVGKDIVNIHDIKDVYDPDVDEKGELLNHLRAEVSQQKALNKSDSITTEEVDYFDY